MKKYRLYLVDMDDTLYEERQYVCSGFRVVAELAATYLEVSAHEAYECMLQYFERQGRERVLDALMVAYGREPDRVVIDAWVQAYRNHQPDIQLYPSVLDTLTAMRQGGGLIYIVTDGLTCMQERKFAALGLADYVDRVVFCHETGHPKPDRRCLTGLVQQDQRDAVLIGDRPDHDLALAANLGIDAIRVRTGRFQEKNSAPWLPCLEIATFSDYAGR